MQYGTYSIYGSDILLLILLCLFLISKIFNRNEDLKQVNKKIDMLWWFVGGFELVIFISIFVSSDKFIASYYYLRFLLAIGLFILIFKSKFNPLKLKISLLTGIFIQAVI